MKCPLPGEYFVQDQTECVNIAADGDFATRQLLGRHIGSRALAGFCRTDAAGDRSESEIGDEDFTAVIDHDIGGLEIAVQHTFFVGGIKTGAEVARDVEGLVCRQPSNPAQ